MDFGINIKEEILKVINQMEEIDDKASERYIKLTKGLNSLMEAYDHCKYIQKMEQQMRFDMHDEERHQKIFELDLKRYSL